MNIIQNILDIKLINNVVHYLSSSKANYMPIVNSVIRKTNLSIDKSDAGTVILDNNLYYNTEATRLIAWRGTSYSTAQLAAFRTATGQETHGIVGQNPNFVSASDYHLQAGSPAINAGVDVGLTTDCERNPIVGLPDIGAYEKQ